MGDSGEGKARAKFGARAGKHVAAQMQREPNRKLFNLAAKKDFLGWYAASGNCKWAAEKAGFNDATVWRHRADDPEFAAAFDEAAEQGIQRSRVFLLEQKMRAGPYTFEADRDVPEFEVDPQVAIALIGAHDKREAGGGARGGRGGRQRGRMPRVATNGEVEAALHKRLLAFARRVKRTAAAPGGEEA